MKRLILGLAAALAIAGCATPTPYQPYQPSGVSTGGFSEVRISRDRFRITFSGNSLTTRETVERYLLYRAAELTVAEGYDWFALADRRTDRDSRTIVRRDPFGYDYWRPQWAYVGNGRWIMWDPWGPGPFWMDQMTVDRIDRYEATAEIFMGRGAKPENDPTAFEAREVIANLSPTIVRPA